MSEYSISYHIRVGDSLEVQKLLRQAKFSGVTFGPANGWLTFVPYADSARYRNADGPRFAVYLCKLTGLAILYYCYAEDHGWTFALARADCPLVQFACWWDPRPSVERDQFDPLALAPFVASELLEPLLRSFDHNEAFDAQPAYRFAELLGLPAYQWLSPELAQNHTDDLLAQGGRKLGTKPAGAATRLRLPPNRKIELPQPYLSGREALDLIVPFMAGFKPPWRLTMLTTQGFCLPDGRGVWQARWRYGDSGDMVWVALLKDGRLSFSAHTVPSHLAHLLQKAMELPERWLDSTDIAPIVERLPVPNGFTKLSSLPAIMMLRSFNDLPLAWAIHFSGYRGGAESFASWDIYIDAVSGDVMAEHLGRLEGSQIVPARQRRKGGDWEDLTAP
jgi:hypothetical protein